MLSANASEKFCATLCRSDLLVRCVQGDYYSAHEIVKLVRVAVGAGVGADGKLPRRSRRIPVVWRPMGYKINGVWGSCQSACTQGHECGGTNGLNDGQWMRRGRGNGWNSDGPWVRWSEGRATERVG